MTTNMICALLGCTLGARFALLSHFRVSKNPHSKCCAACEQSHNLDKDERLYNNPLARTMLMTACRNAPDAIKLDAHDAPTTPDTEHQEASSAKSSYLTKKCEHMGGTTYK